MALYMMSFREQHTLLRGWAVNLGTIMSALTTGVREGGVGQLAAPILKPTVNMIAPRTAAIAGAVGAAWQTLSFFMPAGSGLGLAIPSTAAQYVAQYGSTVIAKYEIPWEIPDNVPQTAITHALDTIHRSLRTVDPHFTRPEIAPFFPQRDGPIESWRSGAAQRASIAGSENPIAQAFARVEQALPDPSAALTQTVSVVGTLAKVGLIGFGLFVGYKSVELVLANQAAVRASRAVHALPSP